MLKCASCGTPLPKSDLGKGCSVCGGRGFEMSIESDEPSQLFRNKQNRMKGKEKNNGEYLKHAKQDIRRLEKGIDKLLYRLDTEDLSAPEFWSRFRDHLIKLYNGEELN